MSLPSGEKESVAASRQKKRESFMDSLGLKDARLEPMQADASFRRYYRVTGAPKPSLLMEDPPDRPPVPPYVMVEPFVNIARHLNSHGVKAPEIYAEDRKNGLLLIEDFGDNTYTRLLNAGADPAPLYKLAVDALITLHKADDHAPARVGPYDKKALHEETDLFLDWYYPMVSGNKASPEMRDSYHKVWDGLYAQLPKNQETLVLRDYHVDNLILLKDGKAGLLDFQDALIGQKSYDLMSLLEDARRDVPKKIQSDMIDHYIHETGVDRADFMKSYKILSAQRHAKVLGIFVRLAERDRKERYLQFLPHVQKLFTNALEDPTLAPLKEWAREWKVPFDLPAQKPASRFHKEGPRL